MPLMFYRTIVRPVLDTLGSADQNRTGWIILLMVINAVLDFFSIAAFLPVMAAIIDPQFLSHNTIAKQVYTYFEFTSPSNFSITITIVVLLFVLFKNVISLWITRAKAQYAFNIKNNLSSRAVRYHLQKSFIEFTRIDFSRAVNTITHYPLAFANYIILPFTTLISEILVGMFIVACMIYFNYKVLILVLVILLPVLALVQARKRSLKKITHEIKTNYPVLSTYASQVVEGFVEINSHQKASFFYEQFTTLDKKLAQTFVKDQTLQSGTLRLTEIIAGMTLCSLVLYAIISHQPYQQTLVMLGVYAGASFRMVPSINRILHALQQIRTHEYLLEEFKILPLSKDTAVASSDTEVGFTKTIQFKNISFHYPGGQEVLRAVSMEIRKGNKVAITGASGEGKTTLLLLLLGFLQQNNGELLVDDKAIRHKGTWLNMIGYIPQNPYLLNSTIAENIAFGVPVENIDRHKISQLIRDLGLQDMIHQLPLGIDTPIGERGVKLSGGQRQRLAIARVLYAEADILLLDEITNQVDGTTELEIMNLLDTLADKKKTIVMITHKIIRMEFFDEIYKLDKGHLHKVRPS